jgi:hypothetical protein
LTKLVVASHLLPQLHTCFSATVMAPTGRPEDVHKSLAKGQVWSFYIFDNFLPLMENHFQGMVGIDIGSQSVFDRFFG